MKNFGLDHVMRIYLKGLSTEDPQATAEVTLCESVLLYPSVNFVLLQRRPSWYEHVHAVSGSLVIDCIRLYNHIIIPLNFMLNEP